MVIAFTSLRSDATVAGSVLLVVRGGELPLVGHKVTVALVALLAT
jgi:hypothetical protein